MLQSAWLPSQLGGQPVTATTAYIYQLAGGEFGDVAMQDLTLKSPKVPFLEKLSGGL